MKYEWKFFLYPAAYAAHVVAAGLRVVNIGHGSKGSASYIKKLGTVNLTFEETLSILATLVATGQFATPYNLISPY